MPEEEQPLNRIFASLAALAVLAAVLTLGGGTARASSTFYVAPTGSGGGSCTHPDFNTISTAVAAAGAGDMVKVCAGDYTESVTINDVGHARTGLTLSGAQAGIASGGRTFGSGSESKLTGMITVQSANVTIDGFSVTNAVPLFSASAIVVKTGGNPAGGGNAVITNNIIDTVSTADTTVNGSAQAIYLEDGPDGVQVVDNEMSRIHSNRSAKGVLLGDNSSTDPSTNILIRGNSIADVTSDIKGAYGVSVGNGGGHTANAGIQILNNAIDNLSSGGWVHAIGVEADAPWILVRDNSISNLATAPGGTIAVWFENEDTSFSTAHVNNNNIAVGSTAYGIAVQLSGSPVDGTCNWWGAANGPGLVASGSGSLVSANVTYSPWLTSPAPSACSGAIATSKDQCKDDGWKTVFRADGTGFKNQGNCIQYVNTGK